MAASGIPCALDNLYRREGAIHHRTFGAGEPEGPVLLTCLSVSLPFQHSLISKKWNFNGVQVERRSALSTIQAVPKKTGLPIQRSQRCLSKGLSQVTNRALCVPPNIFETVPKKQCAAGCRVPLDRRTLKFQQREVLQSQNAFKNRLGKSSLKR
jgi:hypothetical protein